MFFMILIIVWVLFSFAIGSIANERGRSMCSWVFFSLLISPLLAYLWLIAIPDIQLRKQEALRHKETKSLLDAILMKEAQI